MARLVSSGFPGDVSAPPVFPRETGDVKKCSCVRVNDVLNADPRCQVHGANPAKVVITQVDAETGEVDRRYCG